MKGVLHRGVPSRISGVATSVVEGATAVPIGGRPAAGVGESTACGRDEYRLLTDIITTDRGFHELRDVWNALHAVSTATNPFNQWIWVNHWWQTYRRQGMWRRDAWHIHVQRDTSGQVRAIFPFVVTSRGLGPAGIRKLRLFGSIPGDILTELPEALVWPGYEDACCNTLVAALERSHGQYDWCELDGMALDGPIGGWFASRAAVRGWTPRPIFPYYTLALPASWEALRATLKPHIKKNLRNSHAALSRDGHAWTLDVASDPDGVEVALAEFFRLHAARAATDRGPAHPDHFEDRDARQFVTSVVRDLTAEGRFIICQLRIAGAVVASRLVFVGGGCFYLYHSGFEPAWWRYSVSTTLTAECIKLAIASGAHTVSLSAGKDASKLRWGPAEHLIGGFAIVAEGAWSRTVAATHGLGGALSKRIRPVPSDPVE